MESPDDLAIVIGISDYDSLPKLAAPSADAQLFANWLLDPQAGAGIPGDNVMALTGKVTLQEIQAALTRVYALGEEKLEGRSPVRRCYIYASGHGYSTKDCNRPISGRRQ